MESDSHQAAGAASPAYIMAQSPPFLAMTGSPSNRWLPNPFQDQGTPSRSLSAQNAMELSLLKSKIAQKEMELISSQTEQKRLALNNEQLEQKLASTIKEYEKRLEYLEKARRFLLESEEDLKKQITLLIENQPKSEIFQQQKIKQADNFMPRSPPAQKQPSTDKKETLELVDKLTAELNQVQKSWAACMEDRREACSALEQRDLKCKALEQELEDLKSRQAAEACFLERLEHLSDLEQAYEQQRQEIAQYQKQIQDLHNIQPQQVSISPVQSSPKEDLKALLDLSNSSSIYELSLRWNGMQTKIASCTEAQSSIQASLLQADLERKSWMTRCKEIEEQYEELLAKFKTAQTHQWTLEKHNQLLLTDINACQDLLLQWIQRDRAVKAEGETGPSIEDALQSRIHEWRDSMTEN